MNQIEDHMIVLRSDYKRQQQRITDLEAALQEIRDKQQWGTPLAPGYTIAQALEDTRDFVRQLQNAAARALAESGGS